MRRPAFRDRVILLLVVLSVIVTGAVAALAFNYQRRRHYQDLLRAEGEQQAALRRASAYNRSLFEVSPDALATVGLDGLITDANQAVETVTGRTRQELIGADFSEYFTDPQAARAGYQQVLEQGVVRDYPLEIKHRDGHTTPVLYNASVYRDEAGRWSACLRQRATSASACALAMRCRNQRTDTGRCSRGPARAS